MGSADRGESGMSIRRDARGKRPQFFAKDDVGRGGCAVHHHDVAVTARRHVAQHPHHRGDAAAGGDEQELGRRRCVQREISGRLIEMHHCSDRCAADQVIAHDAVADGLDGDADAAVRAGDRRGE